MSIIQNEDGTVTISSVPAISVVKPLSEDGIAPGRRSISITTADGIEGQWEKSANPKEYREWTEEQERYIYHSVAALFELRRIDAADAVVPTVWNIVDGVAVLAGPFSTREDALNARAAIEHYTEPRTFSVEEIPVAG